MQSLKFFSFALSAALAAVVFTSCKKDKDATPTGVGTVDIEFEHKVGGDDLDLTKSKAAYRTAAGDSFRVTRFIYYVSNVQFNRADGNNYKVPNSYFLVNEANAITKRLALADIPAGNYNSLTFTVGVDSARNVSGAQTGALDASNGMFWSWNDGYIFMKLDGKTPPLTAGAPEGGLVFHIGGFRKPYSTIRTVTLPMPSGVLLSVLPDHSPEIHLKADILKAFNGPNPISFTNRAGYTRVVDTMNGASPGPNSVAVADNYANPAAGMFSIEHVHAN